MNTALSRVISGVPAFIGVCFGVLTYEYGGAWLVVSIVALAAAITLLLIGRSIVHRRPLIARWLIESWVFAAIAMVTFATSSALWAVLSPHSPLWRLLPDVADEDKKTISAVFGGAVTAYFAFAWTRDIGEAKGFFWPSTQFKSALKNASGHLAVKLPMNSRYTDAFFNNHIDGESVEGWTFRGRGLRAALAAEWIANATPQPPREGGTD